MLKLSKNAILTDIITDSNPINTEHPIGGSSVELPLWLFNDQNDKRYMNITIKPTDDITPDDSNWIQLAPDNAGVAGTYGAAGEPLAIADISDTVGHPIWIKVTTPMLTDSVNKSDIKLTIEAKEYAV
ncbi:hypothetical protein ACFSTH_13220 [Paenibacillus yanchengensis]|uniref:Uncharacterized protein n=1 Tax=Paenibacillus yanchengensis TaxID=2035833 RepID=A0ABW4YNB4_9BACL